MDQNRLECAQRALEETSSEYRQVTAEEIVAQPNGHAFHRGMHIRWAWGEENDKWFLDFLAEHRMMGIFAVKFFSDETFERIESPRIFIQVTGDPDADKLAEDEFFEHNRRVYQDLRESRLLPPVGPKLRLPRHERSLGKWTAGSFSKRRNADKLTCPAPIRL